MNLSLKNPLNESNIIIVIDSLDGGGAEAQAIKLASGLKKENIKVSIFSLRSGGTLTKKAKMTWNKPLKGSCRIIIQGGTTKAVLTFPATCTPAPGKSLQMRLCLHLFVTWRCN